MRKVLTHLVLASVALSAVSCSDASGGLIGGEPIYDGNMSTIVSVGDGAGGGTSPPAMCPSGTPNTLVNSEGGTAGWHDLYTCYFSTCGASGGLCHQLSGDTGGASSGFVCGSDVTSCWTGITTLPTTAPLVPKGGTPNAATAPLLSVLHLANPVSPPGFANMPLSPAYTFSAEDVALIETWIQGGAQNN